MERIKETERIIEMEIKSRDYISCSTLFTFPHTFRFFSGNETFFNTAEMKDSRTRITTKKLSTTHASRAIIIAIFRFIDLKGNRSEKEESTWIKGSSNGFEGSGALGRLDLGSGSSVSASTSIGLRGEVSKE